MITRKMKINELKAARRRLSKGRAFFICEALNWGREPVQNVLRQYVIDSLVPFGTLDPWLAKHRPHLQRSAKNLKQYRLQWIDWMTNELEKK